MTFRSSAFSRTLCLSFLLAFVLPGCGDSITPRPPRPRNPAVEIPGAPPNKADGFQWGSSCQAGQGQFEQDITQDGVVTVGTIPAGRVNVKVALTSDTDVDIQLYDASGRAIIQWPDGMLSGADAQSLQLGDLLVRWSGYNGDGQNLGHETISIEGKTTEALTMKAYGYAAGFATVDYSWEAAADCDDSGSGEFVRTVEKDTVVLVGTIPAGLSDVSIRLEADVDIDIQLHDGKTSIVQWPDGLINSAEKSSTDYAGVTVLYSGYNGDGSGKGNEYIRLEGTTTKPFVMKVYGYAGGEAKVIYHWGTEPNNRVSAEVVFAPMKRHEDEVVKLIQSAKHSLDIAMYNMKHSGVIKALKQAVEDGVKVRFIYQGAQKDIKDPAGSRSAKIEEAGVDVRYVTKSKIMHHKFMLVDGPRADAMGVIDPALAVGATLVTGSANWAAGNHDENTVFIQGAAELSWKYQAEFNRLWNYAYDFDYKPYAFDPAKELDPATFPDDPQVDAFFTSANFKTNQTFTKISGSTAVEDRIIEELKKAKSSIYIATGHLRSLRIAQTLAALLAARPSMDIKVYVDGQEYKKSNYKDYQAYRLHKLGVPVRFKFYCYTWDYGHAPQMHNKYFIIDKKKLITGSYNISKNSEQQSFENVLTLEGKGYEKLVAAYLGDFSRLWNTDSDGSLHGKLQQSVKNDPKIPLVFAPMSLSHPQVLALKDLIEKNCPQLNSKSPHYDSDFRTNPTKYRYCPRPQ